MTNLAGKDGNEEFRIECLQCGPICISHYVGGLHKIIHRCLLCHQSRGVCWHLNSFHQWLNWKMWSDTNLTVKYLQWGVCLNSFHPFFRRKNTFSKQLSSLRDVILKDFQVLIPRRKSWLKPKQPRTELITEKDYSSNKYADKVENLQSVKNRFWIRT